MSNLLSYVYNGMYKRATDAALTQPEIDNLEGQIKHLGTWRPASPEYPRLETNQSPDVNADGSPVVGNIDIDGNAISLRRPVKYNGVPYITKDERNAAILRQRDNNRKALRGKIEDAKKWVGENFERYLPEIGAGSVAGIGLYAGLGAIPALCRNGVLRLLLSLAGGGLAAWGTNAYLTNKATAQVDKRIATM